MSEKAEIPQQVFLVIDLLDDAQILAELKNQLVSTWAYVIIVAGKQITGLSKVGVDQACARLMSRQNRFYDEELECALDPTSKEHIFFDAKVTEFTYTLITQPDGSKTSTKLALSSHIGTKRQWVKMQLKAQDNKPAKIIEDKFWYEKGSGKAIRNAKKRFISPELEAEIIAEALQTGKVQTITFEDKKQPKPNGVDETTRERIIEIDKICKQLGYKSRGDILKAVQDEFPTFRSEKTMGEILQNENYYNIMREHFLTLLQEVERFENESFDEQEKNQKA